MISFDSDPAAANTAVAEEDTCPGAVAVPSSTGIGADPWPGVSAGCSAFSSGKVAAGSLILLAVSTAAAACCELGAGAGASAPAQRISSCWSSIFLMSDMMILETLGLAAKSVGRPRLTSPDPSLLNEQAHYRGMQTHQRPLSSQLGPPTPQLRSSTEALGRTINLTSITFTNKTLHSNFHHTSNQIHRRSAGRASRYSM